MRAPLPGAPLTTPDVTPCDTVDALLRLMQGLMKLSLTWEFLSAAGFILALIFLLRWGPRRKEK